MKTTLSELRKLRGLTQQQVSTILEVNQSALSKIENQRDIRVSTLERYISALGGEVTIRVQIAGLDLELSQFRTKI